jgi:hypothetical protein
MPTPRKLIVNPSEQGVYHCIGRRVAMEVGSAIRCMDRPAEVMRLPVATGLTVVPRSRNPRSDR